MKNIIVMPAKAGIHAPTKAGVRSLSWIAAFAAMTVLFVAPAFAGNLNFSNGKGMWQSTLCNRPVPPAFVGLGADASAETLNAATQSYNLFVKQSQDYQNCLSAEAKADGEAANALIMQTVQQQMQGAASEVDRAKGQLFGRSVPPNQQ